jgi:hypothetical protein
MMDARSPSDATLLDILVDGFEKNEVLDGTHRRLLPLPDVDAATRKFGELADEARRWKGEPLRSFARDGRRLAAWSDLEIRQAGCGILVRARHARFADWWHDDKVWVHDPMATVAEWHDEEDPA